VQLKHQDRAKWNNLLIQKGNFFLNQSAEGDDMSPYHIEAAIAATHAAATSFDNTDWGRILDLYTILQRMKPGVVVELNKAIAVGYGKSPAEGLEALQRIVGLHEHYLFHAAIGEFSLKLGMISEARESFAEAIIRTTSKAEQDLLRARLKDLEINLEE
jgi:RNA polymerase sigma-70 factor (ECF subfamily)